MRIIYLPLIVLCLGVNTLHAQQPLRTWGDNMYGLLGHGTDISTALPTQVGTADWLIVDGGDFFSAGIQSDGSLWAWGDQSDGQVGDGSTVGTATGMQSPIKISADNDWATLSAGSNFTLAIKSDHTLWGWGSNDEYGLGITSSEDLYVPTQIGNSTADWQSVYAGDAHTLAIKTDGTLWAWGDNDFGKLGIGTSASISATPVQAGTDNNWVMAAAGQECSFGIKADGTLWAWGQSTIGGEDEISPVQIGTATDWQFISSRNNSHFAIKTDGTLWAWGSNFVGQLGIGSSISVTIPTQVGTDHDWAAAQGGYMHTLVLKTDGTLWAMGAGNAIGMVSALGENMPKQIGTATSWSAIAAGNSHSLALGGGDDGGTDIHEYALKSSITLYPNPATDVVCIDTKSAIVNISIADVQGKPVYSGTSKQVDVHSFIPGVYYYRVTLMNKNIYAGSFVKK